MKYTLRNFLLGIQWIFVVVTPTSNSALGDDFVLPLENGNCVVVGADGQATRRSKDGALVWSIKAGDKTGGVRPPHLLADSKRVYLTQNDGVTALSITDGVLLWHSTGPKDRLFLSGDLLLATNCGIYDGTKESGRWLVARHVEDGKDAFRLRLPDEFETAQILDADGLFLVQRGVSPEGEGLALLLNRDGTVFHQLSNNVVVVRSLAEGRLVLTGREVIRLSAKGEVEWSTRFEQYQWPPVGGFVPVPGGDMLAYLNSSSTDSGVQILRFDPIQGRKIWQASCPPLGVTHSCYDHRVEVLLGCPGKPDWTHVISHGSYGEFTEDLDEMGRSKRREVSLR